MLLWLLCLLRPWYSGTSRIALPWGTMVPLNANSPCVGPVSVYPLLPSAGNGLVLSKGHPKTAALKFTHLAKHWEIITCVFIWNKDLSTAQFIWEDIPEALVSGEMNQRNTPSGRSPVWTTRVSTCWEFPAASVEHPSQSQPLVGLGMYIPLLSFIGWALLLGGVNSLRLPATFSHQVKH